MEQKRTPGQLLFSLLFYVAGLFILAFGVAISVNAQLGISPVNSLPYVVSLITNVSLGTCVIIVFTAYLLIQILLLRRKFKWVNLTQLLCSTLFGYFVDLTQLILGDFALPSFVGRLVMLAFSIFFIGLGVALYVDARLIPMPTEGLTLVIAQFTHISFSKSKIIVDCLYVAIAICLSFLFLHQLLGVGLGTIITALLAGKVVALVKPPLAAIMNPLCFGSPNRST